MFYQISKNDTEKPNILSDGTVNRPVQLERNEKRNADYTGCSASASGTLVKKKLNAALIDHDTGVSVCGVSNFLSLRVLSFSYRRSFLRRYGVN